MEKVNCEIGNKGKEKGGENDVKERKRMKQRYEVNKGEVEEGSK